MAKINSFRRISTSEYAGENAQMIETLASSINPFMREVTDALNGGLDFENLEQSIIEFEISVDASGVPQTKQINVGKANIQGFSVISARSTTNPSSFPTGQPFISFTPTGSTVINVNNISNLPANEKFLIKAIVY
jgi:hypothetical protein